jgi:uncharacterized surface protein with fasciclin (FAS1) repeats
MKKTIFTAIVAIASLSLLMACEPAATNTANTNTMNSNMMNSNAMNSNTMNSNMMSNDNSMSKGDNPMVGGAPMMADKNIVENASNSKDHTTLVSAVKAAGLVETLEDDGPFTVFAPTNAAFDKLPKEAVADLMKPENKDALKKVLTYHVVAGKQDAASIAKAITDGNGKAMFKTVQGEELTASMDGDKVVLTDAKGGKATVTIADVMQSNGVIHVVDSVLMPK